MPDCPSPAAECNCTSAFRETRFLAKCKKVVHMCAEIITSGGCCRKWAGRTIMQRYRLPENPLSIGSDYRTHKSRHANSIWRTTKLVSMNLGECKCEFVHGERTLRTHMCTRNSPRNQPPKSCTYIIRISAERGLMLRGYARVIMGGGNGNLIKISPRHCGRNKSPHRNGFLPHCKVRTRSAACCPWTRIVNCNQSDDSPWYE